MHRKLLLVDDELDFAFFLKSNIENSGNYEVVVANNGEDALGMFTEEKPDLVLLDIMMPGLDGVEVLRKLKGISSDGNNPPIVMLSAKRDTEAILESQKYGAVDYLMKPIEINKLLPIISRYINEYNL